MRKIWCATWRLAVCALLMFWILHSIFLNEGKVAWERQGHRWEELALIKQWQIAWTAGTRELWHAMTLVDPLMLSLSIALMGLTIFIGVFRWRMVLRVQGLDLSPGRTVEISFVAHFFNSFLLGSTGGDLLKAYYAARETRHKKAEAVATVFVDRLIGLFSMLLFAALMMLPNLESLFLHGRLAVVAGIIFAMLLGCGITVALAFWGGMSRRLPRTRVWLRRLPKGDFIERSLAACRHFGRARPFLFKALALSMALNAVCVFQIIALSRGMKLWISPLALFAIVPSIICISALPITPSGLGVRENLFVLMLAAPGIHVGATQALSLSLLAYATSLFWSMVGGIVYASLKERHHLADVAHVNAMNAG